MGDTGSTGAAAGARQWMRPQTVAPVAAARCNRPDQRDQPTGAEALRVGALGSFKGGWRAASQLRQPANDGDLVTDVWASGDTQSQHNETDQRTMQTSNGVLASASSAQQARGFAITAIQALRQYVTPPPPPRSVSCILRWDSRSCRCRRTSATAFRSGPWSAACRRTQPSPTLTASSSRRRGSTRLALVTGTDAASVAIHRVNEIAKARAQIALGNYAAAAALVATCPRTSSTC